MTESLLTIDYRVPHFDQGGGDPRMDLILRTLTELWPGLAVTLAVPCADGAAAYEGRLHAAGVEVVHAPGDWETWFRGRRHHFGIVLTSRTRAFEPLVRRTQPQAFRVLDVEALFHRRLDQVAARFRDPAHRVEAGRMREEEIGAIRGADAVWCVSEEERAFVDEVAPATPASFVRYGVEASGPGPEFAERQGMVFLGSFIAGEGSPNEDAALHLVADVMPRLWERLPSLPLRIVGARPTPRVRALHGGPVRVVGYVADVWAALAGARVMMAPMRVGAGVKLKLVDSMAAGLPFVTTPCGSEGLGLGPLERMLVGEEAGDLAERAWRLHEDRESWEAARANLLSLHERRFSPPAFRESLIRALAGMGVAPP